MLQAQRGGVLMDALRKAVEAAAAVDAYLHAHKDAFPVRNSNILDQAYQVWNALDKKLARCEKEADDAITEAS